MSGDCDCDAYRTEVDRLNAEIERYYLLVVKLSDLAGNSRRSDGHVGSLVRSHLERFAAASEEATGA